jgi:hypothetical protein
MSPQSTATGVVFRVIEAMEGPHRGQILRLRVAEGETPTVKDLKGARLIAKSPGGDRVSLKVNSFSHIGGKPSDSRLQRTGRVDLVVEPEGKGDLPVARLWDVTISD